RPCRRWQPGTRNRRSQLPRVSASEPSSAPSSVGASFGRQPGWPRVKPWLAACPVVDLCHVEDPWGDVNDPSGAASTPTREALSTIFSGHLVDGNAGARRTASGEARPTRQIGEGEAGPEGASQGSGALPGSPADA